MWLHTRSTAASSTVAARFCHVPVMLLQATKLIICILHFHKKSPKIAMMTYILTQIYLKIFCFAIPFFCPFLKTQLCSGCGCAALVGDPGHAVILSPTTSIVSFVLNTLNGQPETLLYCKNCNMII